MCSTVGAQVVSVTFRTVFFGFFFLAKPDLRVEPEGVGLVGTKNWDAKRKRRGKKGAGGLTGGSCHGGAEEWGDVTLTQNDLVMQQSLTTLLGSSRD